MLLIITFSLTDFAYLYYLIKKTFFCSYCFFNLFIFDRAFVAPDATVLGRGGHQMLTIKLAGGDPYLYVFGGRGGDNTVDNKPEVYAIFLKLSKSLIIIVLLIFFYYYYFIYIYIYFCA